MDIFSKIVFTKYTRVVTSETGLWVLDCKTYFSCIYYNMAALTCNFPFPPYKHPYPCLLFILPDSAADPPPQVDCPAQGKPLPVTEHICQHHLAWFLPLEAQSKGGTWETSLFSLGL